MFGRKKLPQEVYDLYMEAFVASIDENEELETKVKNMFSWFKVHEDKSVLRTITESMAKCCNEITTCSFENAPKEEPRNDVNPPKPREIIVPDEDADVVLRLWNAWDERSDDEGLLRTLRERLALELLVFKVCPGIAEWGDDVDFDVEVRNAKVIIIECLPD